MTAHVAIVDPASRVAEIDSFNRLQGLSSLELSYHLPALYDMDSLAQLRSPIDAIIILGSGASVYDNLPWQAPLESWASDAIEKGTPILGLCYGHQLLAHILGAKIGFYSEDQEKLVGLRKISLLDKNDFWGTQKDGQFVVSHRELVTELPSDCEVMATSDEVKVDGFRHCTKPVWGMQCHPEAGPGFVNNQDLPIQNEEKNFASGQSFLSSFLKMIEAKHKNS